jgi:glucokinase
MIAGFKSSVNGFLIYELRITICDFQEGCNLPEHHFRHICKTDLYVIIKPMVTIIAVDIGGTQIRAAAFRRGNTTPEVVKRTPTRGEGTSFERMCGLIQSVWPEQGTVEKIVIALPGPLNPETGVIFSAPNIPGWENFPIGPELEKRFGVRTKIGNDANLAALGEWRFGAGQGHHHVLYLTISTGIGGGVISDNHLLLGARGLATELGHIQVLPDGPLCGCGQRGHLEALGSGPAIARYVQEQIASGTDSMLKGEKKITAKEVSQAAAQGDALAIQAIAQAGTYIGQALASFLHIFNPSVVIFGGGVSFSGDLLFEPIRTALKAHLMDPSYLTDLVMTNAALGDDAGLMGALALGLMPDKPDN